MGGTVGGPQKERLGRDPGEGFSDSGNQQTPAKPEEPTTWESQERGGNLLGACRLRRDRAKGTSMPPEAPLLGFLCLPLATKPSEVGLCSEGPGHRSHDMTSQGSTWHVLMGPTLSEGVFPEGLQDWDPIFAHPADWLPLEFLEEPALPLKVWSAPWAIRVGV